MKSTLVQILLSSFAFVGSMGSLSAQSYSEYLNQRVYWNDGRIVWDNFQREVPSAAPDTILSFISLTCNPYLETVKKGRTTYEYYWVKTYMHPQESWCRPAAKDDFRLKMMQTRFDLWELFARKSIVEYNNSTDPVNWNEMSDYYRGLYERRVDELKQIGNDGTDMERLDRYAAFVSGELNEIAFDPISVADTVKFRRGIFSSLGLLTSLPRTDYVSPDLCLDWTFGFYVKSMLYGFSINFGGAKCRKYIETSHGEICKGDGLLTGGMNLMVGKSAIQNRGYVVTPYLGVGAKFYDGGTNFEPKNDNDNTTEKAGFSMGMGALIDVPLRNRICIKTGTSYGITSENRSLQIRPYLSCTKFNGDMGWVPSVNIAVSYSWSSFNNIRINW